MAAKKKPKPIDNDCTNPFPEIPDPFGYGQRAVDYLRSLKHPKSALKGRAFQLDPWQEKIVRQIYGPRDANGRRIIRMVVMLLPRGNRKTSLGAALALLHADGPEAVPAGEILLAASDRKQAKIAFREDDVICGATWPKRYWEKGNVGRASTEIEFIRKVDTRNRIDFPNKSFIEAISSDAGTQHGRTPVFALVDEIHAWKKRDLFDVIRTGLVKVAGSLCVIITTAGRGQENIAFNLIDYARQVAKGEVDDPATLPILFETSADADWQDEAVWAAANPGLQHGYPDIEGLRQLAREASQRPADREAFRQLHLNVWLGHSSDPFVDMGIYDQGKAPVDLSKLEDEPCWLAVDLSSNSDLTVIVAAWRDGNGGYIAWAWFFCPADNLQRKADVDHVPYPLWADDGFIEPTPGSTIDFSAVEDTIRDLCRRFNVREIAFDPHMAHNMMQSLLEGGYPAVAMRQGWVTMAPAVKELERAILGRQLRHGGHPILRHHVDCVAVHTDSAGNRLFHKGKSRERIDGAVALAMAVSRAATGSDNRSIYDDVNARPEGLLVF